MSLGFLTESALLPSKAKAIKVDSKSLVDLRAVVFQKEQERQERKRSLRDAMHGGGSGHEDGSGATGTASSGTRGFGRFAHLKATKKRGSGSAALSREEERMGKASNRGVEKRRKQDEAERENELDEQDDDKAWHKKSREMLAKKAKLYDDMMSGRVSASSGSAAAAVAECLVDFGAKKRSGVDVASMAVEEASESVEITDEFGRTRVVTKDSAAYAELLRVQTRPEAEPVPSNLPSSVQGPRQPSSQPANGSFVVSQWEKRFNSEEKSYLQEVHEGVSHAKSALVDKKSRKQLRLEKLRRQASTIPAPEQPHARAPESRVNAHDDQAAAVKATEFLNQLGSLV